MICVVNNMKKFMKKILILIPTILLCFIVSFCQEANKNNSFLETEPKLNPSFLLNPKKTDIDIHDTAIQTKIHLLDCYFAKRVAENGFNGSVLISYKGTPILEGYYGYADYYKKTKLNKNTSLQIASTSKTFTSAAILILQQEGYLNIDDTLQKYFPNFPYKDITIKMLLNHRSGLPSYLTFSEAYWLNKKMYMSNADVLNQLIKFKPKIYASPDRQFKYNNTNYVLLALIIEKVSGYSYTEFMQRFIFTPLGMNNTYIFDPKNRRPNEVRGYTGSSWREDAIVYTDGVVGDKGIYSTVLDLYKWDQALYAGKLISSELQSLAFTPQSFEQSGSKNYGLGWRMKDQADGTRIIYHNGWWHSFNSVFNRKISDGTSVIILSSHYSSSVYKIQEIWDILYGHSSVDMNASE